MSQAAAEKIGVFLVEAHTMVRQGIALILERESDMQLVGWASDGRQALEEVGKVHPDVLLTDIELPGLRGIDAITRLAQDRPEVSVIVLTSYAREDLLSRALEAGAKGYLLKDAGADDLLAAIRTVYGVRSSSTLRWRRCS